MIACNKIAEAFRIGVACVVVAICCQTSNVVASSFTINSDGVLLIDGKKVFPIGLTMGPPVDGKTPAGADAFDEIRAGGVRFLRSGPVGKEWNDAAIEAEQQLQDAAARHGLYCMPYLHKLAEIRQGDAAREAMLRKVISRFKDHPALGVWKGADEPQWGKIPLPPLITAYQIIKEADPHHPIWIVQAPRGNVDDLRPYDPAYDILGCDIYPISYPPGGHSLRPNKQISMVGDYTQLMREVAGDKPLWMTLQIAFSGVARPGKTLRFPTFPEERFMTYQAIINGARGLVYFGGNLPTTLNERDAKLGWNWTFWERVLRPVLAEISPESPLAPALIAPQSKLQVTASAKGVELCVREAGDDLFLLACKREGDTVQVRFSGLPSELSDGEVVYESPRHVTCKDGQFTDWFAPFDVHVYRFRK